MKCPEKYTPEFVSFLLVNAIRGLTKEQFHSLTISLVERDTLWDGVKTPEWKQTAIEQR